MPSIRIELQTPDKVGGLWGFPSDPSQVQDAATQSLIQTALDYASPELLPFAPLSSFLWVEPDKAQPVFTYSLNKI